MAETPTFKLVLVGDGGTGKVSAFEPRYMIVDGRAWVQSGSHLHSNGHLMIFMDTLSYSFVTALCPRACHQY